MRLRLLLFMLILLPLATGVHAWLFYRDNQPLLTQEAVERLKAAGVRDPVVELRFFDLAVSGEAPDPAVRQRALASLRALAPMRLKSGAEHVVVRASLGSRLEDGTLYLSGWFPQGDEIQNLRRLLAELRPDLKLDTKALHTAAEVSWPEGMKLPLTTTSPLLKPLIDTLHVPAELHVRATEETIVLSGLLPDAELKAELVAALAEAAAGRVVDPAALKASPHVQPAAFTKTQQLAALVSSFFSVPGPRSFDILRDGTPHLSGMATRHLESVWLALLRPVTGAAKVDAQFTLVPSVYHMPGYRTQSQLSPDVLKPLHEVLRASTVFFDTGSANIPPQEQTKLALLAPTLLAAGPALRLVIGAHPDPSAPVTAEKALGQARAEAVLSFLVHQGVPAADISATVFDSVPAGSPTAPSSPRSVELLIK